MMFLFLFLPFTTSAFATVKVSSPAAGATVTSPVHYVATASSSTCSKGVTSMGVYVDNKLIYTVNGASLNTEIKMASGAEHTVVEEWDKCGKGTYTTINLNVTSSNSALTVAITANPGSITAGSSSTLTVTAAHSTAVKVTGSDGSSFPLAWNGGTKVVSPASTTTYTATATGANSTTAKASTTVTVGNSTIQSIAVSPDPASFATGSTQQFTATATYSNGTTGNVTASAVWSVANTAVATIATGGLANAEAAGSTTVTAAVGSVSGSAPITVTVASTSGVNVPTWHFDTNRSGLNANETSLTPANVGSQTFGKRFSYIVDGYAYAQPLLVSNVTINGGTHNVLYVATEHNDVYAFDADNYGTGAPLWHVSLNKSGETATTGGPILPFEGVTSTPAIDLSTSTIYIVSKHHSSSGEFFRLSALNIMTGAQKLGGPVKISASVKATNSAAVNGVQTLTTACTQRSALLLAYGNVYFGFGSCHTGWLLGYDAQTLKQTGVFNASPNLNGEGQWASAGGVWMGGGGPASNGDGSVYITTGNGPWDGKTAWSDSILKFSPTLKIEDYFTPYIYQYMDCADGDLASGGLLLIPGTSRALAAGKLAYLYLVSTTNLGQEQAGDAGALWTGAFESDLSAPFSKSCKDVNGTTYTVKSNQYEIYGTSAYFNGSVYLGISASVTGIPAGLRQFTLSGSTLTPASHSAYGTQVQPRGYTPFISANGTSNGIVWMVDQGIPLGNSSPTIAVLRAFDPADLSNEFYNSDTNAADKPGYGIKFVPPIVANGKVYISTGKDLTTASNPSGEIDVYGLN